MLAAAAIMALLDTTSLHHGVRRWDYGRGSSVYVDLPSDPARRLFPDENDAFVATVSHVRVAVVPLASGGSDGISSALVFAIGGLHVRLLGRVPSVRAQKLVVRPDRGTLLLVRPVYACAERCVVRSLAYERIAIRSGRLHTTRRWTGALPPP